MNNLSLFYSIVLYTKAFNQRSDIQAILRWPSHFIPEEQAYF